MTWEAFQLMPRRLTQGDDVIPIPSTKRRPPGGASAGLGAPPVLPEILRQNLGLFQCFYGAEEQYTLCLAPELAGAEIICTGGGHHFGGDYRALAEKILDGAARRLNATVGNKASLRDHATQAAGN